MNKQLNCSLISLFPLIFRSINTYLLEEFLTFILPNLSLITSPF